MDRFLPKYYPAGMILDRHRVVLRRGFAAFALLPFASWTLVRAESHPFSSAPGSPSTVAQIKALSPDEADRARPVTLRGVITLSVPALYQTFLQDSTGGIYVRDTEKLHTPVKAGDLVEVEGITGQGGFAPILIAQRVHVLGKTRLPEPKRLEPGDLGSGTLDARYVEVDGLVRSAFELPNRNPDQRQFRLVVAAAAQRIVVRLCSPGSLDVASLVGATIRVRGPLGVRSNRWRQLVEEQIVLDGPRELQVLAREPSDPFLSAPVPMPNLLRYRSALSTGNRVRVQGWLTLVSPGRYVILQNGDEGIKVETAQSITWPLGSFLDAVGFPQRAGFVPHIEDAQLRFVSRSQMPQASATTADDAASGERDGEIIRLKAYLVAQLHCPDRQVLWLKSGDHSFSASIEAALPPNPLDNLKNGSFLDLTGIPESVLSMHSHEPIGFHLYLRSPKDVSLLQSPPWWTGKRMLQLVILAVGIALAVLTWNLVLRHRVRKQTRLLARSAAFEQQRTDILEQVGRNEKLAIVLYQITRLTEEQISGCKCEIAIASERHKHDERAGTWSTPIISASGEPLATLHVELPSNTAPGNHEIETVSRIARLAGIAIEHRRLYEGLYQQSQTRSVDRHRQPRAPARTLGRSSGREQEAQPASGLFVRRSRWVQGSE